MRRGRIAHVFFDVSVIGKGLDGALETIGGMLLLFVDPMQLDHVVRVLTQHELSEDPHDLVATFLLHGTRELSGAAKTFAAIFLLWHGMVKVTLVTALLYRRRWAYPTAILAFSVFLVYQLYRYLHTRAPALLMLSAVDLLVIGLTWLEYQRLRAWHGFSKDGDAKPRTAWPG